MATARTSATRTALIGRADLARLLHRGQDRVDDSLAARLGYIRVPDAPVESEPLDTGSRAGGDALPTGGKSHDEASPPTRSGPEPRFWRPIARETLEPRAVSVDWLDEAMPLGARQHPVPADYQPREVALLAWPRLLGFLRQQFVTERRTGRLDEQRLVARLARGELPQRIPWRTKRAWPNAPVVILDAAERVFPLRDDYRALLSRLESVIADVATVTVHNPAQLRTALARKGLSIEGLAGRRVLILSDLGQFGGESARMNWVRASQLLATASGAAPLALVPTPVDGPSRGTLIQARWDHAERVRVSRAAASDDQTVSFGLTLLSQAARARPRLIRKLLGLSGAPIRVRDELAIWTHADVNRVIPECWLEVDARRRLQGQFHALPQSLRQQVADVISEDHAAADLFVLDVERQWTGREPEPGFLGDFVNALNAGALIGEARAQAVRWVGQLVASSSERAIEPAGPMAALNYLRKLETGGEPTVAETRQWAGLTDADEVLTVREGGVGEGLSVGDSGSPVVALRGAPGSVGADDPFWVEGPPDWASDWGTDRYGHWMEWGLGGETVRMRWIAPGTFAMGSPEDETERDDDERLHTVMLTQGYWLADTACTQALWRVVVGGNPSEFRESTQNPVETVSYEDVEALTVDIEARHPGIRLRLPTEAEWEYACRAGTSTAFSLGDHIDSSVANFDGERPLHGGEGSEFRQRTVEVRSFPPNAWGLFEMHGNVFEWCADWFESQYPGGPEGDPIGPETGTERVLRGGSWFNDAGGCRSAYRDVGTPGYRYYNVGFRLARGQQGARPSAAAGPGAERRAAGAAAPRVPALAGLRPGQVSSLVLHSSRERVTLESYERPHWASGIGRDRWGLFADVVVLGVQQRFRWIAPGTFLMGSPEDEPERQESEVQHEVTLSQGYWLADTACSQSLWTAVMGENPSRFHDDPSCPVESVSHEEVTRFLEALGSAAPGLIPRLPSEAEWEHACRAGTSTPFWQGGQLDSTLANFDGNFPMPGGTESDYRERTMRVRSFAPNPWGLYQMHGNVLEWCSDWYGDYPKDSGHDPAGHESGTLRVLRGGSWFGSARYCRSAFRYLGTPDFRLNFVGFRLARGQQDGPVPPAVAAERQPQRGWLRGLANRVLRRD